MTRTTIDEGRVGVTDVFIFMGLLVLIIVFFLDHISCLFILTEHNYIRRTCSGKNRCLFYFWGFWVRSVRQWHRYHSLSKHAKLGRQTT